MILRRTQDDKKSTQDDKKSARDDKSNIRKDKSNIRKDKILEIVFHHYIDAVVSYPMEILVCKSV